MHPPGTHTQGTQAGIGPSRNRIVPAPKQLLQRMVRILPAPTRYCDGCRRCPMQPTPGPVSETGDTPPHPCPAASSHLQAGSILARERVRAPSSPHSCRLPQERFRDRGGTRHWGAPHDPSPPALGSVPDGSRKAPSIAGPRFLGEATDLQMPCCGREMPSRPAWLEPWSDPVWSFMWWSTVPGTATPVPIPAK